MTIDEFLAEIKSFCQKNADPKEVERYARFFKEGYNAYGVPKDLRRKQKDMWLKAHKEELGLNGFLDLGDLLIASGKYEEGVFAITFLIPFREEFTISTFERLGAWLEDGIRNWAHSDILCGELLSFLLKKKIIDLPQMSSWMKSLSKWKRRAVPVTLLGVLDEGRKIEELIKFIEPLMLDSAREVQQGLGWFLREAWKREPDTIEAFLLEWKDTAPRLIFQYATEKMSPSDKERFRRKKS